jgi:hypothetical protein
MLSVDPLLKAVLRHEIPEDSTEIAHLFFKKVFILTLTVDEADLVDLIDTSVRSYKFGMFAKKGTAAATRLRAALFRPGWYQELVSTIFIHSAPD